MDSGSHVRGGQVTTRLRFGLRHVSCSLGSDHRSMRYKSLACDFDGTLAENGKISLSTLAALGRLKASGRSLILVTGRLLEDLCQTFAEYAICDRIVAENGALIYKPSNGTTERLAAPASQ